MSVKNFLNLTSAISSRRGLSLIAALATAGMPMTAHADNSWNYDSVDHGTVAKDLTDVNHTKITVNSTVGVVSGNMDIYANDTVSIGGTGSIFAYKDNRANVNTQILGKLNSNSNMTIVMVDRDGTFFGADSVVNVGSIVVASQINESQLISGKNGVFGKFDTQSFGDERIDLNGEINIADSGIAAFVSPTVVNNGVITARVGKVAFAAGEVVTLDLYGDQLIEIAANSQLQSALLENNGTVSAEGGEFIMTAQTARDSVDAVVNMNGIADVSSVSMVGGKIVLSAGKKGNLTVKKHSKIKADGTSGGSIKMTAGNINIAKQTQTSASGAVAGGTIEFNVNNNMKLISGTVSATGTGGRIDFTVGNTLSIWAGGSLRSETVSAIVPTLILDGDVDATNLSGTATLVRIQRSINGAQINDGIGLAASGATIEVGAGTYNEAVNVNKSVKLVGAHSGTVGDDSARGTDETIIIPNSPGFLVTADNVTIDGFTVDGGDAGVIVDGADNTKILNNVFVNQTHPSGNGSAFGGPGRGDGVYVTGASNTLVQGNNFSGQNDDGIQVNDSRNIRIVENTMNNKKGDIGISISDSYGLIEVLENDINKAKRHGVVVERSSGTIRVSDNTVKNSGNVGIVVRNNKVKTVEIDGNTVKKSGGVGILVENTYGAQVTNNTVKDSGLDKNADGITLKNASYASITGNDVNGASEDGIDADNSSDLLIARNQIDNVGDDAIDLDGSIDATIEYNKVGLRGGNENIGDDGIDLDNSAGAIIRENTIRDVVENGIDVRGSDDTKILANNIRRVGDDAIYVNPSDNIRIHDNVIRNAGSDGIYVSGGYDVRIRRNDIRNVGSDGIDVNDNDRVRITDNIIIDAGDNGIEVSKSNRNKEGNFATVVARNTITETEGNGVDLFKVGNARVADNIITDVKNGIKIKDADTVRVRRNEITDARRNGVKVENVGLIDFRKNVIKGTRFDGINLSNFDQASFFKNDVRVTGDDGLEASGGSYVEFIDNTIRKSGFLGGGKHADERGADGISAFDIRGGLDHDSYAYGKTVVLVDNDIRKAEDDGIEVSDSDSVWIEENTIRDAGYGDGESYDGADYYGADGIHVRNVRDNSFAPYPTAMVDGESSEGSSRDQGYGPNGSPYDYDVVIIHNDVRVTGDDGVEVVGEDNDRDLRDAPLADGYRMQSGTGRTLVAWNTIRDSGYGAIVDGGESYGGAADGYGADGIHVRGVTASNDMYPMPVRILDDSESEGKEPRARRYGPDGFGYSVEVLFNDVKTTGDDGIEVRDGGKTLIADNKVKYTGLDTYEYGVRNWEPDYGYGANEGDGITVNNVFDDNYYYRGGNSVEIIGNVVNHTGDDGIDVHFSGQTLIADNKIRNSGYGIVPGRPGEGYGGGDEGWGHDGIHVGQVYNGYPNAVTIVGNDIKTTADDGIEVHKSGATLIKKNKIRNSGFGDGGSYGGADELGADGISVHQINGNEKMKIRGPKEGGSDRFDLRILGNDIAVSEDDGIEVHGTHTVLVRNNTVDESGDDGIRVIGEEGMGHDMMAQISTFDDGPRRRYSPSRVRIVGNTVSNSGTEAPARPERGDEPTFKTKYRFSGGDGIQVEGFDRIVVKNNVVSNSVENGLYVSGGNNGRVKVSGNTFTDNDTGASFESGVINLTKEGNEFNGGRVGLKFSPAEVGYYYPHPSIGTDAPQVEVYDMYEPTPIFAKMRLVDNTVGSQLFNGQSEFFIELDNGAFFNPGTPTILSALDSTFVTPFGNVRPASQGNVLSSDEFNFINSKIFDYRDRDDLGLFFFGVAEDDFSVNQEELFNAFDPYKFGGGDVRITILGLPSTNAGGGSLTTGPAALNNLSPAAGGEEEEELTPEELNAIASAAGAENKKVKSWGDAISSAQSGGVTTFSFGSTLGADAFDGAGS